MKHLGSAATQAEVVARIRTVRPDSPGKFGTMSAPQMVVHCTDSFRVALGLRAVSTGGSVIERAIIKYIALYAPITWPPGYPTRPEVDPTRDGTKPGDFVSDVADLVRMLERFGAHHPVGTWRPHPMFGAMTESQWHRWGYLHIDHHLRQFGA